MVMLRNYLCCPDNTLDPIQYLSMCILRLSCHEGVNWFFVLKIMYIKMSTKASNSHLQTSMRKKCLHARGKRMMW